MTYMSLGIGVGAAVCGPQRCIPPNVDYCCRVSWWAHTCICNSVEGFVTALLAMLRLIRGVTLQTAVRSRLAQAGVVK